MHQNQTASFSRTELEFISKGIKCTAWLYLPETEANPPVVIMAHGFGAEKDFVLPEYAKRFAARGLAVFLFDYRNFGQSDGRPRNLVNPKRHLQDWQAALGFVRSLEQVDGQRIGLWGTSFSGGHVIVTAANDKGIKAIVSQVPFVDGVASLGLYNTSFIIKAMLAGFKDLFRSLFNKEPYCIPVVAEPGRLAVMNGEDAMSGYLALVPKNSSWKNECPARVLLTVGGYRPVSYAPRVACPAQVLIAEDDNYIPAAAVEKTASKMPRAEIISRPVGHFDVYAGDEFEMSVTRQCDFFIQNL